MNNIQKGRAGESIALRYLINNRANILETNYRINSGEIDIIAKKNEENYWYIHMPPLQILPVRLRGYCRRWL